MRVPVIPEPSERLKEVKIAVVHRESLDVHPYGIYFYRPEHVMFQRDSGMPYPLSCAIAAGPFGLAVLTKAVELGFIRFETPEFYQTLPDKRRRALEIIRLDPSAS